MKRKMLLGLSVLLIFAACKKEDDSGGTNVQQMSGEWWVKISVNNSLIDPRYFKVLTYNTSENLANKMWLDDQQNIWPVKIKVDVNPSNQTFSSAGSTSEYSNITVKVNNGKVMTDVTKGPVSKAATDSIYFEAEFSDDAGTVYQFAGYRRTRFADDDH
jgi:hypothetical protein